MVLQPCYQQSLSTCLYAPETLQHRSCVTRTYDALTKPVTHWRPIETTCTIPLLRFIKRSYAVQWRSHVADLMNDLDDVLAARSREVAATPTHQFA